MIVKEHIRILVLEDNVNDFQLIKNALRQSDLKFEATRVDSRSAFLSELKTTPPNIILSDHGLPQFDGITALRTLRQLNLATPFIFVAGALGEQTVIEAFELGANDYVLKDHLQDLVPAIRRVLHRPFQPTATISSHLDSPDFFRSAVEQAKEAVVITTAQLDLPGPEILYVNKAFCEMTGYAADEVLGRTPRILQGRRTDRKVLDRLKAELTQGKVFEGETYKYRKNGEEFILQWEIAPLRDSRGKTTHFISVQRDVTRQRRDEKLLLQTERTRLEAESSHRILQILNRVYDAFVSLDRNWVYTFVNVRAGELFNRRPEDLIGKHIWTEFPEGVGQPFQKAYEKAMAEQKPATIEALYEPWQRWFENRIYPSPEGLCIFFHDITEAKRQREELQASLDRFELVTRLTHDVIYDWDISHDQITWNQNYYSVFQYNFERPEKHVSSWISHLHPDERENVVNSLYGALSSKANFWELDYRFRRGDNLFADVADRGYIVRDENGNPTRMVGAMIDVS